MKITRKTTVQELKDFLTANAANVKATDENLSSMVDYTLSHDAKRQDLIDLAKQVITTLGDKIVDAVSTPAAAETAPKGVTEVQTSTEDTTPAKPEVKKSPAKGDTKPPTENLVKKTKKNSGASAPAPEESADEKSKKSSGDKKTAKKSDKDADLDAKIFAKAVPLATSAVFPNELTIDGEKFTICHDEVKSLSDMNTDDYSFEIAFLWTKRDLRQFKYISGDGKTQPKSFKDDLDLCQLIYVSDDGVCAYAVSDATEGLYTIRPEDMEELDGLRYCNGIEFSIYRAPQTSEDADETNDEADDEDEGDET